MERQKRLTREEVVQAAKGSTEEMLACVKRHWMELRYMVEHHLEESINDDLIGTDYCACCIRQRNLPKHIRDCAFECLLGKVQPCGQQGSKWKAVDDAMGHYLSAQDTETTAALKSAIIAMSDFVNGLNA